MGTHKNRLTIRLNEAVLTCIHDLCFEQKLEKYHNVSSENYHFYSREISPYITWACNITLFLLKITIFTAVKYRLILHGHVIVIETAWSIKATFHVKPPWNGERKFIYSASMKSYQ